jgi:cyclopropane-fatty-acyl-phospholipid synthase
MSDVLSIPADAAEKKNTLALLERLFPSPRNFVIRLWDGSTLPGISHPAFTLVLNHPGALRRMFTPPIELSLGEAFIYGDFEIEGDIFSVFSLVDDFASRSFSTGEIIAILREWLALPSSDGQRLQGRGPARMRGAVHSLQRDRAAIQYHYDVGNAFYALWLDHNLQYSCGYFPTGKEDVDTAQERKLEHICRKLRLQKGERLLDIGCGWGGLAIYAAKHYGVEVLGVTLSQNQKAWADEWIVRAGLREQVAVQLRDYRDLGDESFDKLVSVGMFEHVGRSHLPEYFAQTYRLLKPGGLFLNHGISRRAGTEAEGQGFIQRRILGRGSFQQRYIFPDGELTPVSEVNVLAEYAGFEVRDVENLREHYALTLRRWVKRLMAHREEAIKVSDEVTYRTWRLYMSASAYGFESGNINVNQTLLAKMERGHSQVPLTRADLYASEHKNEPFHVQ